MTGRPGQRPLLPPGLRWRLALAWAAILWERLWPALWPVATLAGLFLASALLGFWRLLPGLAHAGLLIVCWLTVALVLGRAARGIALPTRQDGMRRLELASGLAHRPLAALDDRPAAGTDPAGAALWQVHRARLRESLHRLRVGWPRPGVAARDRWSLGAAAILLLVLGLVVAGDDWRGRIAQALQPEIASPVAPPVIDAWIDPPAYTGLPPLFLTRDAGATAGDAKPAPLLVPANSQLHVQMQGGRGPAELLIDDSARTFTALDRDNRQIDIKIEQGSRIAIHQRGRQLAAWAIQVVPDRPPVIAFAAPPEATARHAVQVRYQATDDYGVAKVWLEIRREDEAAPLVVPLALAGAGGKQAAATSFHDLTPHPWAGLPVTLILVAEDATGQRGQSAPQSFTLPARPFHDPVARALVEQRRRLSEPGDRRPLAALALSAIARLPEAWRNDLGLYLGLTVARWKLLRDGRPAAVTEVQDLLWDAALHLEDGGLSLAERALRDAQQALREALERKAPDAEIERRLQTLREAVDRFLQALQQKSKPEPGAQAATPGNQRSVSREDLQRLLDRTGEMAKSGARDAARQMLDQLQALLENLQPGRPGASGQGSAMSQLDQLMQSQKKLLDETFRSTRRQIGPDERGEGALEEMLRRQRQGEALGGREPGEGQPGRGDRRRLGPQGGEGGADGGKLGALAQEQDRLRRALGELLGRLGRGGAEVPDGLKGAGEAMGEAGEALQDGAPGEAIQPQTQALQRLRDGAAALLEQMRRRNQDTGQAGGGQPGQGQGEDPLGRPAARGWSTGDNVRIPDRGELQQSREILDELYRRAGERERPDVELEYLDRLLRRF